MSDPDLQSQFDHWAQTYDRDVATPGDAFPFAGYAQLLATLFQKTRAQPGATVLDVGIGTANLARTFLEAGCHVTGLDFSSEMLVRAHEKYPALELLQADLATDQWPTLLEGRRFDHIVSNYLFHEFPFPRKLHILTHLARLTPAPILIGDIIFPTAQALHETRTAAGDAWDEEDYWILDRDRTALQAAGWTLHHHPISFCAAILTLTPPD